jgi:hypothetical protein
MESNRVRDVPFINQVPAIVVRNEAVFLPPVKNKPGNLRIGAKLTK